MSLSNFPAHLLEEIFTRLAVKTLIILTTVCKPWLELISSPSFVQSHLSRYHLNPDNHLLLITHPYHKTINISPLNFLGIPTISRTLIPVSEKWIDVSATTSAKLLSLTQTFVGSINGLVCFSRPDHRPTNVVIWNPATHRFKDILVPQLNIENLFMILVAFGFDFVVNDYKIVCLYAYGHLSNLTYYFLMYSCNNDSWKELKPDSPLPLGFVDKCVTVKGNPYWKCLCKQINEFWVKVNVETEAIQMFSGLDRYVKNKTTSTSIMALGGFVAQAIFSPGAEPNDILHVYTLEENSGVWMRMYTFELIGLQTPVRFKCYNSGKLIFTAGNQKKFYKYDLTSKEIKDLMVGEGMERPHMPINYTESLVAIEGMKSMKKSDMSQYALQLREMLWTI